MNIKKAMPNGGSLEPVTYSLSQDHYYIHPTLRQDLESVIATIKGIDLFGSEMGARHHIFKGPPGVGKTLGVKYVATAVGCPVIDCKTIANAQQVSELFKTAREQAKDKPLILLMDELDKFSSRDESIDPTQQLTLNQLLTEMDGAEDNGKMFIIGTTNRPNKIDNALRRPKRFAREIEFPCPDREGRLAVLKIYAYQKSNKAMKGGHAFNINEIDLNHVADVTFGYTPGDIVGLLDEAFTKALMDNQRTSITQQDFEYALKKTNPTALKDMSFIEPRVKLDDIAGYEDHKAFLHRLLKTGKGSTLLLYGPPGTGKSTWPEALAGEFGYNYMVIYGNEAEEMWVGKTKDNLKKMIDRAKLLAPCIINFDEIGSLVAKKQWTGGSKEGHTGYLQAVLANPPEGVYFFASDNEPHNLTKQFRDRFLHRIYVGLPSKEDQLALWKKHLPKGIDPQALVDENCTISCREIKGVITAVNDFGLEPTQEVYLHLAKQVQTRQDLDYDSIVRDFGDSIANYRKVKALLGGNHGA